MGFSKFWLFDSKGFIDKNALFFEGLFDTGNQRPMKITKYQDAPKKFFREGIDFTPLLIIVT